MLPVVAVVRFVVGGNMGWSPYVNYTAWVDAKNFYNGEWLFFVYDRNQVNVLEVNQTDYESCNSDNFLHNWTTGAGRDVVPLNVTRTYYFISGQGFCFSGMKLTVYVEDPPAPAPSKRRQQFPPLTAPPTVIPVLLFTPAPSPSKPGGVLGFSLANGPVVLFTNHHCVVFCQVCFVHPIVMWNIWFGPFIEPMLMNKNSWC